MNKMAPSSLNSFFLFAFISNLYFLPQTLLAQTAPPDLTTKIALQYGIENQTLLKNPKKLKDFLMEKIRSNEKKINYELGESYNSRIFSSRGELYLWLGKLEREYFLKDLSQNPGSKASNKKSRKKLQDDIIAHYNETKNLLGNAEANYRKASEKTVEMEKNSVEILVLQKAMDDEFDKFNLEMTNEALEGVNNPSKGPGIFAKLFLCFGGE